VGKDKLRRFAENATFANMVQPTFEEAFRTEHLLKGNWHSNFFKNANPLVLELGCGKGEYAYQLGKEYLDRNFLGVDIKGARMWKGAKMAIQDGLTNIGFLRTRIEFIQSFFAPDEVSEIWITFPDPQLNKNRRRKRLTASGFLNTYRQFLKPDGIVHLKTDSHILHHYTKALIEQNGLKLLACTNDLYNSEFAGDTHYITTHYESIFKAQGIPITYLRFTLSKNGPITEPVIDEEALTLQLKELNLR